VNDPGPGPLALTSDPDKQRLYLLDPAYRSGHRSFHDALGDLSVLHRRALAILRPDAFAFRRAHRIVEFLRAHDLVPIAWRPFRFSWHQVLDLWRYQLTKATDDRLGLGCELLTGEPSVLVLLAERRPAGGIPASVRLWSLKGAFDAQGRGRGTLRDALAVPHRMFGFLHTADEPIDLIREVGVLLSPSRRLEVLRRAEGARDRSPGLARFIAGRYARVPPLEWMTAPEALGWLRARRGRGETAAADLCDRIEERLGGGPAPRPLSFGSFYPALRDLRGPGASQDRWVLYMLAAHVLPLDRPGVPAILSSGRADRAAREWADRGAGPRAEAAGR
jgi:hypothetical protein